MSLQGRLFVRGACPQARMQEIDGVSRPGSREGEISARSRRSWYEQGARAVKRCCTIQAAGQFCLPDIKGLGDYWSMRITTRVATRPAFSDERTSDFLNPLISQSHFRHWRCAKRCGARAKGSARTAFPRSTRTRVRKCLGAETPRRSMPDACRRRPCRGSTA